MDDLTKLLIKGLYEASVEARAAHEAQGKRLDDIAQAVSLLHDAVLREEQTLRSVS